MKTALLAHSITSSIASMGMAREPKNTSIVKIEGDRLSMAGSVATTNVTTAIAKAGRLLRIHTMNNTISLMKKVKPCLRSRVQARCAAARGAHERGLVWSMRSGAVGYSRLAAVWIALFKRLPLVDNMRLRGTHVVAFANSVGVLSVTNMT